MDDKEFTRRLNILEKNAPKVHKELQAELTAMVTKDIEKAVFRAVHQFYASYRPDKYIRYGSLYNAYNLSFDNNKMTLEFGSEFMEKCHRVDKKDEDYIYEVMFKGGWHGGATSGTFYGQEHPAPGIPYYVDGVNHKWLRRAERMPEDESPYSIIEKYFKNYEKFIYKNKASKIRQKVFSKYF